MWRINRLKEDEIYSRIIERNTYSKSGTMLIEIKWSTRIQHDIKCSITHYYTWYTIGILKQRKRNWIIKIKFQLVGFFLLFPFDILDHIDNRLNLLLIFSLNIIPNRHLFRKYSHVNMFHRTNCIDYLLIYNF